MNFQNPYFSPYPQTPYIQPSSVIKVNGENGARAFSIGANSSALLLDESGLLVWLITTDGAGYKTVTPYDITPHQADPVPDYGSLENRIKRLEDMINGITADTSATRRRNDPAADPADDADGSFRRKPTGYDRPAYAEQSADAAGYGSDKGIRERSETGVLRTRRAEGD